MLKFIENVVEFLAMVKIALSPILLFLIIGFVSYLYFGNELGTTLLILCIIMGLVLGVLLAWRIHKKHGAVGFNAKIMSTPELDKEKDKTK